MRARNELSVAVALVLPLSFFLGSCAPEPPTPAPEPPPPATGVPAPQIADEAPPAPPALPDLHLGLDVSHHSGTIDWHQVAAAGHTFAFVKATEGVDSPDEDFQRYWAALKEVGLMRGAYHFYVTEDDPEEQARFFLDTVDFTAGDLVPVVDLELIGHGTQPGLVDRVKTWLDVVEKELGVKPIIYTSPNFWDEHMSDEFGEYPLWIAEYGVDEPRLPRGWTEWHLWQWQEDAEVPGVESGADLSHVNRAGPDLTDLVLPESKPE